MSDLKNALNWIIQIEGGLVNNPSDPGGVTKFGISQTSYPNLSISSLHISAAKQIYTRDYWDKCNADKIPYPVNIAVFDMAVNCGVTPAVKLLQTVIGVTADGVWGEMSRTALAQKTPDIVFNEYLWKRVEYYKKLKKFSIFGRGWIARLLNLREYVKCLELRGDLCTRNG
jgi:lysozyme family protein